MKSNQSPLIPPLTPVYGAGRLWELEDDDAYLKYLYSDEAQELIAENYYRPVNQKILKKHADTFNLNVKLTTIKDFGGWDEVQKKHFADGGVFDEIYEE